MNKRIARYFTTLMSITLFSFLLMEVFPSTLQAAWWFGSKKTENKQTVKPVVSTAPAVAETNMPETNNEGILPTTDNSQYQPTTEEESVAEQPSSKESGKLSQNNAAGVNVEKSPMTKEEKSFPKKALSGGGGGRGNLGGGNNVVRPPQVVRPPDLPARPPQVIIVPRPPVVVANPNANRPPQQPVRAPERPPQTPERPPQNPNNR